MITIRPLLAPVNHPVDLRLSGLTPGERYRIRLWPVRAKDLECATEGVADRDGIVTWQQTITVCGEVRVGVFAADPAHEHPLAKVNYYVAPEDLARRRPLRTDFHIHTFGSDGHNTVEETLVRGRELGLDALAITDHNVYDSSRVAIDVAERTHSGLICLTGEKVSNPNYHMLSIGASGPAHQHAVDRRDYASMRESVDLIHELGGRAFLAHPMWDLRETDHLPDLFYSRILDERVLDGIELLGDVDWEDNIRCLAHWTTNPEARRLPVLGNSDTHAVGHTFGGYFSLVWVKEPTREGILAAIAERRSVACGWLPLAPAAQPLRTRLMACGDWELVDLAYFLAEQFLPLHDELCKQEADLMRRQLAGEAVPPAAMASIQAQLEALYQECWPQPA